MFILTKIVQHSIIALLLVVPRGSPYFVRKLLDFNVNIALFLNAESFVNRNPQNRIRRAADICTYAVKNGREKIFIGHHQAPVLRWWLDR